MPSANDLPELFHGDLDANQLDALFEDLVRGAQVRHVQMKTSAGEDRRGTLTEARELLRQKDAKAVQIRYIFDGQTWCDTLLAQPTGVRLVRTKLDA